MPLTRTHLSLTNMPLSELLDRDNDYGDGNTFKEFDLDAPYQRGHVWTTEQKVNLIRSLLEDLPIGAIFVNERSTMEPRRVVDGKQRMTAIRDFFDGKVRVPREWFADRDLNLDRPAADDGHVAFDDLSVGGQRRLMHKPTGVYVSRLATEAEERDLFNRINYGGTPPAPQDEAPGTVHLTIQPFTAADRLPHEDQLATIRDTDGSALYVGVGLTRSEAANAALSALARDEEQEDA